MKNLKVICMAIFVSFILINFCIANEQQDHICFKIIDADKDGEVTIQEFEKYFGNDNEKFKKIDLNKDGKLSHDEYHKSLGHGASKIESK